MDKNQLLKADLFGDGMLRHEDRYSKVFIKHLPIMITDKGKILCIPLSDETSHLGLVAQSGKGKGIGGNSLLGMHYWLADMPCVILNDFQQETFEMSLPCSNETFNDNLRRIGMRPNPLPIVYVYPSSKNLNIKPVEELFPHIKMCLPTEVVIKNIEQFYKLDKSGKYVTGYIEEFLDCRNLDDIDATIDKILKDNFPESDGKKFEEMKFKIRTIFKNIFDEQITDTAAPADAYAYLTVNSNNLTDYKNLTIQGLMACKLIPSIQTSDIKNERWFSAYMAFIVNSIYTDKYEDSFFKNKNVCLYIPEIDKMWKTDVGLDKGSLIARELCLTGTNGRRAGMRMIWDCQDYAQVKSPIRDNTKFLLVGQLKDDEQIKEIKKDFNVDKDVENWIKGNHVDQKKGIFEFVMLTTDKIMLYNPRDGTCTTTSEAQRGRLITPMAGHKESGVPIEKVIGLEVAA